MTRDNLIETAAKAIYIQRNGHGGTAWEKIHTQHREPYRKDVRAVLKAIEAQGLAIVPVEATEAMENSAEDLGANGPLSVDCWEAMMRVGRL